MNVIVAPRAGGKTYQMIQWYKQDPTNRVIVVENDAARRILVEAGVARNNIHVLQTASQTLRGVTKQIGLDISLDLFIAYALGLHPHYQPLGLVTINGAAKNGRGEIITPVTPPPPSLNAANLSLRQLAEVTGEWID